MITYEEFVAVAREVVAERPNFVYLPPEPTVEGNRGLCRYVKRYNEMEPDCLIGCIMARLNLPLPVYTCSTGAFYVLDGLVDRQGCEFATNLQRAQDSGIPWGQALQVASAAEGHTWGIPIVGEQIS